MPSGSVIVDLAAERGGNCELTRPDESVVHRGVTILGPSNPPALAPYHASQMYSRNIITFLTHLLGKTGAQHSTMPIDTAATRPIWPASGFDDGAGPAGLPVGVVMVGATTQRWSVSEYA